MVEGTPLLRAQTGNRLEGSNPFVSATLLLWPFLHAASPSKFPVILKGYSASMVLGKTLKSPRLPHISALSPVFSLDLLTTHFSLRFQ